MFWQKLHDFCFLFVPGRGHYDFNEYVLRVGMTNNFMECSKGLPDNYAVSAISPFDPLLQYTFNEN